MVPHQPVPPVVAPPQIQGNTVAAGTQPPPFAVTAVPFVAGINLERVMYVVFDLETTGVKRRQDEIIEIAAVFLNNFGVAIEDATFDQFVKPTTPIPAYISRITGVYNTDVKDADPFPIVADAFLRFLLDTVAENQLDDNTPIDHVVLVGHNARVFDIPFFLHQLDKYNMLDDFFANNKLRFCLDTYQMAKKEIPKEPQVGVPSSYKLAELFQFITGREPITSHRALADVKATISIFLYHLVWNNRQQHLFQVLQRDDHPFTSNDDEDVPVAVADDSDVDDDSGGSSGDSSSDEEETVPMGDAWEMDMEYTPADPTPTERFNAQFTTDTRSRKNLTGLQCSTNDVKQPIRAWRQIFTKTLLQKIVNYTNEYANSQAKHWIDITKKDLEAFIAILFISGIQKRKDKPSHWFSDNAILENTIMKKVMSGRKFFSILRYLHCCPLHGPDRTADDYDPAYKVAEMKDYMEDRYRALFIPGQQLSLDETLVRAFGRIKFKVRIVTKAARYGIKIYVLTDAATAYVLKVIIYTGKSTYFPEADGVTKMKTVQIVERLVEPFVGTHRTIYVDRFYTSLDLLKSMEERGLFVTGTVLQNRIPAGIRILKSSRTFKDMNRGDVKLATVKYTVGGQRTGEAGLVCWRDRNIVYCLSNDMNNHEMDECTRRGDGGLVRFPRPKSIANYNRFMGGVDLADMRRLHCNSTIMGQNRWWLKLFFYLLDVGTSNALVLYNEGLKSRLNAEETKPWNIVKFKTQLVEDLTGKKQEELVDSGDKEISEQHVPIRVDGQTRYRCTYCALKNIRRRTRHICAACGIPLCCLGNGKVDKDCFSFVHDCANTMELVRDKFKEMQKTDHSKK